jgi:hypothetical protein
VYLFPREASSPVQPQVHALIGQGGAEGAPPYVSKRNAMMRRLTRLSLRRVLLPAVTLAALLIFAGCSFSPGATPTAAVFDSPVVAAGSSSPLAPAPPTVTVATGFGAVRGKVASKPSSWGEVTVYLAGFTPLEEGSKTGWYVLEPSLHPHAKTDSSGYFVVDQVPPGQYVVVVGPTPEDAVAALAGRDPLVIEVKAGQVTELGDIVIR